MQEGSVKAFGACGAVVPRRQGWRPPSELVGLRWHYWVGMIIFRTIQALEKLVISIVFVVSCLKAVRWFVS